MTMLLKMLVMLMMAMMIVMKTTFMMVMVTMMMLMMLMMFKYPCGTTVVPRFVVRSAIRMVLCPSPCTALHDRLARRGQFSQLFL